MSALISVVIPVYNAEKYLSRCIDSIICQTHRELEIILVDDGSSDNSLNICKQYAKKDKRVVLIHQENKGVSEARNIALKHAHGEYICFCDSDDWIEKNMYSIMLELLEKYHADVSIVGFIAGRSYAQENNRDFGTKKISLFSGREAILEMHRASLFQGQLWNKMFKRSLFQNVELDPQFKIFEDLLVHWPLFLKANRVVFQDYKLYHYVTNSYSAINQSYRDVDWQRITACEKMLEIARKRFPDAVPYVNKTMLMAELTIAERMIQARVMTKEKRASMQKKVKELCSIEVNSILTPDRRFFAHLFVNCYFLFAQRIRIRSYLHRLKHYISEER